MRCAAPSTSTKAMTMSDFDDRELRDSLQRLAGHPGDETAAYAVVQQRVRVAKRRRAVVGGSGLIALCIAGFVLVGFDRRSGETLTPATDGITVPTDVAMLPDVAESTDDATTVDPPARSPEPPTSVPTVTNAPTTHAVDNSVPRPTVGAVATNGGGDLTPPIAEDTPGSETGTTAPDTGESSDTAGDPTRAETQTFTSAHGSLTVSMRDGRLSIVGQQAEAGYSYSVERAEATQIRVRFRSGEARSQIDVSIVDGRLVGVPSEEGSGSPSASTAPSSNAPSSTEPATTEPTTTEPTTTDDHGSNGGDRSGSGGSGVSGSGGSGSDDSSG